MKTPMDMIREFEEVFATGGPEYFPRPETSRLRIRLMKEELKEVCEELEKLIADPTAPVRPNLAKEIGDLLYVVYGTAERLDIDADEAFRRVHASNMSKQMPDGSVKKDSGGKVLKGPNYREPDMSDFGPYDSTVVEELPA